MKKEERERKREGGRGKEKMQFDTSDRKLCYLVEWDGAWESATYEWTVW